MKKTIVIVEDEEPIAHAQKLILEDTYHIHLVHDGADGLNKIKELKPDVAILDVMLPGKSGFDICKELRGDPLLSNTKVIMVTAKDTDRDEAQGMNLGADDYIMKPFEPDELLHVVNQVLTK